MSAAPSKNDLVEAIYKEEFAKDSDMKTMRKRVMDRVVADKIGSTALASTYFSNAKKKFNPDDVATKAVKVISAIEKLVKGDSNEVYSMVTVDKHKIAVDVKCFENKDTCLEECNKLNKHFVKGLQKRGKPLNTIDVDWVAELDKPYQAEYEGITA